MTIQEIKKELLKLPKSERQLFIKELENIEFEAQQSTRCQDSRGELLNNKQGVCFFTVCQILFVEKKQQTKNSLNVLKCVNSMNMHVRLIVTK